jgi:hypothetical protein
VSNKSVNAVALQMEPPESPTAPGPLDTSGVKVKGIVDKLKGTPGFLGSGSVYGELTNNGLFIIVPVRDAAQAAELEHFLVPVGSCKAIGRLK